jgi:hypothetical protein
MCLYKSREENAESREQSTEIRKQAAAEISEKRQLTADTRK